MIILKNTQRSIKIPTSNLKRDAQAILDALGYPNFDLSIWITTNATIRRYNRDFRGKDKPTDILSFPFHADAQPNKKIVTQVPEEMNLGDLIVSAQKVLADADEYNMLFSTRLRELLVHGICHLLGYDHITDDDYEIMHAKEQELLKRLEK